MASKKIVLSPEEQEIENMIERRELKPVSPTEKAKIMAQFHQAYANLKKGRGGARKNAGRKPLGHIPTVLALEPEVRDYLIREAGGQPRGMSAVVNRVFGAKVKKALG